MSAFMVNTNVMAKVVTAILLNLDQFDGERTCRVALLASPTDAQKEAGNKDRPKALSYEQKSPVRTIRLRRASRRSRVCV
jgi:hypothetical protein